ncbi:MAG: FAD:protein FMN transferase [Firmicutes bacterium]|jgi:thiamine biosynthesis lipoprotein|nr:FAD:protein FMN transferase [Bacillota bacterium]
MRKYILVIIICILFCGCQIKNDMAEIQMFAMDTFIDLKAQGENGEKALLEAEKEINRLEKLFSPTIEQSEIFAINQYAAKQTVTVSKDTFDLIEKAKEYCNITEGAFDITIAPVVKAWGFTEEVKRVPSDEEIQQKLQLVDNNKLHIDKQNSTVYLENENMSIDLGGIAKGYASNKVNEILKKNGVSSAVISLGGNVSVTGKRPDGTKWRIAVQDPMNSEGYVGILNVEDTSVITSGVYQRFFEQNGKKYHHIIDTKTGKPTQNGLLSVTIVCDNGAMADALSTSVMVAGLQKGSELWRKLDNFGMIVITDSNEMYISEDIEDIFEVSDDVEYTIHIIQK